MATEQPVSRGEKPHLWHLGTSRTHVRVPRRSTIFLAGERAVIHTLGVAPQPTYDRSRNAAHANRITDPLRLNPLKKYYSLRYVRQDTFNKQR